MNILVPTVEAATNISAFGQTINPIITNLVNPVIMLLFAVAVVAFVFGVLQMVFNKTDAEAHTKGRWAMLGGVVGMFIMISAWGIINLVSNTVKQF